MTPVILLDQLEEYLKEKTKNIMLQVRTREEGAQKERPAKIYKMNLPKKKDEVQQVPYILLKYLTGIDEQQEGQYPSSQASIRIIVAVYGEDAEEGGMALLNVISNIRYNLLKDGEVGQQFRLLKPIQSIIYPEDTRPYYLGEIMTQWSLPKIEREIDYGY